MNELLDLAAREGVALVLALLLPLFGVAAGAAIVAGWFGAAIGVRDPALGQCLRALAIVAALGVLGEPLAASATEYARRQWSSLAEIDESHAETREAEP
ncbi:hypothetical protein ACNOYE_01570 [Nannocystaceae bacterium ST9]